MQRLVTAALACCVLAAPAQADLLGQSFTATYEVPTLGAVYAPASWSPPSFTVGAGTETSGLVEGVTTITVDFSASQLTLLLSTTLIDPTWGLASFNGPVFTAAGPLGITGVTLNAATTLSGFTAGRVGLGGNAIAIDWNGLTYDTGDRVVLDFAFAVPEPASLALLGGGLLGLAGLRRRSLAKG